MKYVPKKNVSAVLTDVKDPKREITAPPPPKKIKEKTANFFNSKFEIDDIHRIALQRNYLKKLIRFCLYGGAAIVIAAGISLIQLNAVKNQMTFHGKNILRNFEGAAAAFAEFRPETAADFFKNNRDELLKLQKIFRKTPFLQNAVDFNRYAANLSAELIFLKSQALSVIWNDTQGSLIKSLKNIRKNIASLRLESESIRNSLASMKEIHPKIGEIKSWITNEYLKHNTEFYELDEALKNFIAILEGGEKHFLLLFQNPAELRPGGGFLGSFGNVTVKNGGITSIEVEDIYRADAELEQKTVPPLPLQAITTTWGARDANWFFSFPLSAKKTIEFLENSKMYKDYGLIFEGAIALNFRVVEDILKITGPIELPEYRLTITAENFLAEVQEEVEGGPDKAIHDPKRILKVLAPKIIEKIKSVGSGEVAAIFQAVEKRLAKKDIMIYLKDDLLQSLISKFGFAGEPYDLGKNFFGSYLAVVNANIAGGKSDAYVAQTIKLEASLDITGKISEKITVVRSHKGDEAPDFWLWKSLNQNYLKIFVAPGSEFISLKNNSKKTVRPPINYEASGYVVDAELNAVESSLKTLKNQNGEENVSQFYEYGKDVFAAWFNVKSGASKALELEVERETGETISSGKNYQFIFDKQSGSQGGIEAVIESPAGYKWRESDSRYFSYVNPDPDKRIIITVHLKEI